MKKLKIALLVLLVTLTACGGIKTVRIDTPDLGSFELPESFKKQDSNDGSLYYSDVEDGYYFGDISFAYYDLSDDLDFESYVALVKDEYIVSLAESVYGEVSFRDPVQTESEIDGKRVVRTTIKGDDDFVLESIDIEMKNEDGVVSTIGIIIDYSEKKYPKFVDQFLKTYKLPQE